MWGMMSLIKFIYLFIKKFFFWPHHAACRILAPGPSAMKALSPNHWTAREFPHLFILSPDALFVLLAMWRVMPQPFLPYHPRGSGPCPRTTHLRAWTRLRLANSWQSTKAWRTCRLMGSLARRQKGGRDTLGHLLAPTSWGRSRWGRPRRGEMSSF